MMAKRTPTKMRTRAIFSGDVHWADQTARRDEVGLSKSEDDFLETLDLYVKYAL